MNISDQLTPANQCILSKPAVHHRHGHWTYSELWQNIDSAAIKLHSIGIQSGNVIALEYQSELIQLVALLAIAKLGATSFSLPSALPAERRFALMEMVGVSQVLSDQLHDKKQLFPVELFTLQDLNSQSNHGIKTIHDPSPQAPWSIVVGSGSTGKPKLMPISHAQQWARLEAGQHWLPYESDAIVHSLVRLDFYAARLRYLEALAKGAAILLAEQDFYSYSKATTAVTPTVIYGTVFHLEKLLQLPKQQRDLVCHKTTALLVGGSTVSASLRRRTCEILCGQLYVLYGANECSTSCCTRLSDLHSDPVGVGRPHLGFEIEIVSSQGQSLPPGEVGEIRIRSKTTISEYWHDETATALAFREGWFYPGDLGKWSDQGQMIHLGRRDDMMIFNGINLYPQELETYLHDHHAVGDAVVLPIRHPVHQDIPVALVSLKPNAYTTQQELIDHLHNRLGVKCLRYLWIEASIPRNEQGKLDRSAINQRIKQLASRQASATSGMSRVKAWRDRSGRLTCIWNLPAKSDLRHLDNWLVKAFELKIPIYRPDEAKNRQQLSRTNAIFAREWILRAGHLALQLFEAGRIPILDPPALRHLTQADQSSNQWQAVIDFPALAALPLSSYELAMNMALQTLTFLHDKPYNEEQCHQYFSRLGDSAIPSLQRSFPAGKSTLPVLAVAKELNIPFLHLGGGVFQLGWGANGKYINRSSTEGDSAMGSMLSNNKKAAATLLRRSGLPAPDHILVRNDSEATVAAQRLAWPVVVKPVDCDRGEGVTVQIFDEETLKQALAAALAVSKAGLALVEKQVPGVCHRLLIAHGRMLYAVKRLPLGVMGDGIQTVTSLVMNAAQQECQRPPWRRAPAPCLDELALAHLRLQGVSSDSVPDAEQFVALRPIETTAWGGVDEDMSELVHPHNVAVALRAASTFGLEVAGIDLITPDITQPWHSNGGVINEVNAIPQLGGGAISRAQIPGFLRSYLGKDIRVPVEVFVGGLGAWEEAVKCWQRQNNSGVACYLANEWQQWGPGNLPNAYRNNEPAGHWFRCESLLLSRDAEVILLVVQSDELLETGLPLDRVSKINFCDTQLQSWRTDSSLPPDRYNQLHKLLSHWAATPG